MVQNVSSVIKKWFWFGAQHEYLFVFASLLKDCFVIYLKRRNNGMSEFQIQ